MVGDSKPENSTVVCGREKLRVQGRKKRRKKRKRNIKEKNDGGSVRINFFCSGQLKMYEEEKREKGKRT